MKRIYRLSLVVTLLGGLWPAGAAGVNQPVYIYLYSRVSDHINVDLSEQRIRHLSQLVEKYRKAHPEFHASATILLSGTMSEFLSKRAEQTHVAELVKDYAARGVIEAGYDGTDEPTYKLRPLPDFSKAKTAEDRWLARSHAAGLFLSQWRNPLFGVSEPGDGGLKEMQKVFGDAACITGVTGEMGSDPEVVHQLEHYNTQALMFGMPEDNPANVPGFGGGTTNFGTQMSPVSETPPELYWQDNMLRTSETGARGVRVIHGDEGVNGIKSALASLDRSKIHVIHVDLDDERMYFYPGHWYPPLKLAWDDPGHFRTPRKAFRDADDLNYEYAKQEGMLRWLVEEFFPANPGSHFVSSTDLKRATPASVGFDVPVPALREALEKMVKAWGNDSLAPALLRVGDRYLSTADMFLVMTEALAERNRTKRLPETVAVTKVFGPIELVEDHGPNQAEVPIEAVAKVSAELASRLRDTTWEDIPRNMIPTHVTVGATEVNAAQFLRLMAEALIAPEAETTLKTKMTYMYSTAVYTLPTMRAIGDQGGVWTVKPAPVDAGKL